MTDHVTRPPEQFAQAHAGASERNEPAGGGGPFRLALPLYLVLLLAAALLGATNQGLRARHAGLIANKASLNAAVARAEVRAATVEGPLAVAQWAVSSGMVPLPRGRVAAVVAPDPAPEFELPEPSLELRTVWR